MSWDTKFDLMTILACIILIICVVFGVNACTASEWNDGFCPMCNVRYEMGGVYEYMKYYYCPKCGNEVHRY